MLFGSFHNIVTNIANFLCVSELAFIFLCFVILFHCVPSVQLTVSKIITMVKEFFV